jgi:hypothetical protein
MSKKPAFERLVSVSQPLTYITFAKAALEGEGVLTELLASKEIQSTTIPPQYSRMIDSNGKDWTPAHYLARRHKGSGDKAKEVQDLASLVSAFKLLAKYGVDLNAQAESRYYTGVGESSYLSEKETPLQMAIGQGNVLAAEAIKIALKEKDKSQAAAASEGFKPHASASSQLQADQRGRSSSF